MGASAEDEDSGTRALRGVSSRLPYLARTRPEYYLLPSVLSALLGTIWSL